MPLPDLFRRERASLTCLGRVVTGFELQQAASFTIETCRNQIRVFRRYPSFKFGMIVGQGRQGVNGLVALLDDEELMLPAVAVTVLEPAERIGPVVDAIQGDLAHIRRVDPVVKLLSLIPEIGPRATMVLAATCRTDRISLGARVRGLARRLSRIPPEGGTGSTA